MKQVQITVIPPGYIYRHFANVDHPDHIAMASQHRVEITDPAGDVVFEWPSDMPLEVATKYVDGYEKAVLRYTGEPFVVTTDSHDEMPKDLRDEFALAVLPDIAKRVGDALDKGIKFARDDEEIRPEKYVAGECYSIADAMMVERRKP